MRGLDGDDCGQQVVPGGILRLLSATPYIVVDPGERTSRCANAAASPGALDGPLDLSTAKAGMDIGSSPVHAAGIDIPAPPRKMRPLRAPVAQWIERPPPKR